MQEQKRLEVLNVLAQRLTQEYADDPNVLGVGWGMARRGGELRPEMSLVFFVRRKLSARELKKAGARAIPTKIDYFPTDVVERGPVTRTADMAGSRNEKLYDPLLGGVASANLEQMDRTFFWSEGGRGTLGILCRDADGREMALSNWHVWADDGASNGDRIVQPSTPDAAGYAEGVAKAILCGPFISSFIEGRIPSGLAAGLYAGAAAAAIAAAMSDEKDPFRRGQDATPEASTAISHRESLAVSMKYENMLPWPGKSFKTNVRWEYVRHTNLDLMKADADEKKDNAQVLRGYAVAPDRAVYQAGDTIVISAVLWDHQYRPEDAYHVVAHLVSAVNPNHHLRLVLHPVDCHRFNLVPPVKGEHGALRAVRRTEDGDVCLDFRFFAIDQIFGHAYNFGPIAVAYFTPGLDGPLRISRILDLKNAGLFVPDAGVVFRHAPAKSISICLAHDTEEKVRVTAYNAFDRVVDEALAPTDRNVIHTVKLEGNMITHVRMQGGEDRLQMFEYCLDPVETADESYQDRDDHTFIRCFRGAMPLPSDAPTGRWIVYLAAQNVNSVPDGVPPENAATIIGGHVMGPTAELLGCGFMLLGDHVFDIF